MSTFSQNKFYSVFLAVILGLCFFRLALPSSFSMDSAVDPLFSHFPKQLGAWVGEDTAVDERTYEILETRNVLSRLYQNQQGEKVDVLLVGSHKDRRVAHPPEVCYISSNFDVIDSGKKQIKLANGNEVIAKEFTAENKKDKRDQQKVLYLYKVGDQFTTNYYAQQLFFALNMLKRQDSQVLLIRLAGRSEASLVAFLSEVLSSL